MRRKPYQRSKDPTPIWLTERDKKILEKIYSHDGILSLKQIDRLFFSGMGRSPVRDRMRLLYDNGYVNGPTKKTIHQVPYGETVYWLDTKGAQEVASLRGETLKHFPWRKRPRYSMIKHDLEVNDFRIDMIDAINQAPDLSPGEWIPEGHFRMFPDKLEYKDQQGKDRKRLIQPDGFFTILDESTGKTFAFLLEMDMGTEDNPRFARDKVVPGVAYVRSKQFCRRFGLKFARWLVVTTGQRRCVNMKKSAERYGGNGLFYFTCFDLIKPLSFLTSPIWWLAGKEKPQAIIPNKI